MWFGVLVVAFNFEIGLKVWFRQAYSRKSLVADLLKIGAFFFWNLIVTERMNYDRFKIFMYSFMMKCVGVFLFLFFLANCAGPNY